MFEVAQNERVRYFVWRIKFQNTFSLVILPLVLLSLWDYLLSELLKESTVLGIFYPDIHPRKKKMDVFLVFGCDQTSPGMLKFSHEHGERS